jgi:glycosyltransferase involved in cell wall biosynthesis
MKNIIFYNPSFETGGVEKNIKSYIEHAYKLKIYNITLLTLDNTNIKKNLYNQYPPKKFEFKNRLIKYFIGCYYLLKFTLQNESIIISFQNNIFALLVSFITKTKIAVRLNTSPEKYINSYFKNLVFSFCYRFSDLIIVNDEDFKISVKKYFNIEAKIVHNFVDLNSVKNKSKEKININLFKTKTKTKIISVGRLTKQKNHMNLLKAVNNLRNKDNIELVILGSGKEEYALKNYIKKNYLDKFVRIIGYKKNPFKYIKHSNVFILPSEFEGSPNILLEAACLKKLIISSNCKTGPKRILSKGKGGYLYQTNNYIQLSRIIEKLKLEDFVIKKKILTAYMLVKKYNKKNQYIEFEKVIKNLVSSK